MGILDDMKKMVKIEAKPTEQAPYERPAKDGRTSSGFVKPKAGTMGNQNMNKMMKEIEEDELGRSKGK